MKYGATVFFLCTVEQALHIFVPDMMVGHIPLQPLQEIFSLHDSRLLYEPIERRNRCVAGNDC